MKLNQLCGLSEHDLSHSKVIRGQQRWSKLILKSIIAHDRKRSRTPRVLPKVPLHLCFDSSERLRQATESVPFASPALPVAVFDKCFHCRRASTAIRLNAETKKQKRRASPFEPTAEKTEGRPRFRVFLDGPIQLPIPRPEFKR